MAKFPLVKLRQDRRRGDGRAHRPVSKFSRRSPRRLASQSPPQRVFRQAAALADPGAAVDQHDPVLKDRRRAGPLHLLPRPGFQKAPGQHVRRAQAHLAVRGVAVSL